MGRARSGDWGASVGEKQRGTHGYVGAMTSLGKRTSREYRGWGECLWREMRVAKWQSRGASKGVREIRSGEYVKIKGDHVMIRG